MLSAMLMASGTNMLISLSNSLDYLFERASAPHFTQSHSGEIDQRRIDEWSAANSYVKSQQTCKMINIRDIFIMFEIYYLINP
jgi:putative ABC transport system permease protein